jgi:hypothetical protein
MEEVVDHEPSGGQMEADTATSQEAPVAKLVDHKTVHRRIQEAAVALVHHRKLHGLVVHERRMTHVEEVKQNADHHHHFQLSSLLMDHCPSASFLSPWHVAALVPRLILWWGQKLELEVVCQAPLLVVPYPWVPLEFVLVPHASMDPEVVKADLLDQL